jgi:hypothetical protein
VKLSTDLNRFTAPEKKGSWSNPHHAGWPIHRSIPSFSPRIVKEAVGKSQASVDGRLLGLSGLYHRHVIGTFNTCSRGPTHRSLTDTGRGYNHLRAPPSLQFNQTLSKIPNFKFKGPLAVTWPSDHSPIYRGLQLRLAMANILQILARSLRIIQKVFLMHLYFWSTPTNLMHNRS